MVLSRLVQAKAPPAMMCSNKDPVNSDSGDRLQILAFNVPWQVPCSPSGGSFGRPGPGPKGGTPSPSCSLDKLESTPVFCCSIATTYFAHEPNLGQRTNN